MQLSHFQNHSLSFVLPANQMGDKLRLSIGILGNGASLLLYTAPILTFSRVFKKKSTEEFSCFPYVMTLFNCLIYTWYGLPIVSHLWENLPLVTINGVGILLESIFIFIYFCYATSKEKIKVGVTFVPVIVLFGLTTAISAVVFDDHRHRKSFVGSVGLVASISMYGSPLIVMKKVIETKSVEYMPFYLSFFSFLASSLWLAYGLLSHDLFLASPNLVATPLGILQLIIYFKYKNKKELAPRTMAMSKRNDDEKDKTILELVVDVDRDGHDADEKNSNNAC